MGKLIFYDLKNRFRSPVTWILIWVILILSYVKIDQVKTERLNRPFLEKYDVETAKLEIRLKDDEAWRADWSPQAKKIFVDTAERMVKAEQEGDYKKYNKYFTFARLLYAKEYMSHDPIRYKAAEKEIRNIWDQVSDGVKYDDVPLKYGGDIYHLYEFGQILNAKLSYYLYENDLEIFYSDEINNVSFSYYYLIDILPMILLAAGIVLIYNSVNKDINTGSIKLVLTQGLPRWQYYIAKYIGGVLHILSIAYIPLIIVSTILGFKYKFINLKYPVFYYPLGFKDLIPRHNYIEGLIHPHQYASISRIPRQIFRGTETIVLGDEIIPFYKFLILGIFFSVLFILFAVALGELISALINNEVLSFIMVLIIFLTGYKISEPFIHERHYNLSPFTMNNPAKIINGSCNVTALTSFIILSSSTIILIIIGITYFKRKEI